MTYEYTNSRGQKYYLHKKDVKLRGSGKIQTIYFFRKNVQPGSVDNLPMGYKVREIERTGLPVLEKTGK